MASNSLPHSWPIKEWPADIYPNKSEKARYLVRANCDSLMAAGALVRIGRELVILGEPYARWMKKKASRVPNYQCPANKGKANKGKAAAA